MERVGCGGGLVEGLKGGEVEPEEVGRGMLTNGAERTSQNGDGRAG